MFSKEIYVNHGVAHVTNLVIFFLLLLYYKYLLNNTSSSLINRFQLNEYIK
jgi:hypothetical protein